ncbi:thymidine kinase, cytosolic-like [Antedon mediterranea]|uniref:thymidine kinase, cytosolic-like n=1 Tax=Antedon mediterranea TaxID=105859 RepID=UPI003AF968CF
MDFTGSVSTPMNITLSQSHSSKPRKRGQIQVIFGPMFSGKTTELVRRIKRYQIANHSCLLIKYIKDDRYSSENISTHDRHTCPAVAADRLYSLLAQAASFDVIGIDEGQFFTDCVKFCEEMANLGKIVIVAALDGTFQRKGFGEILNLVPLAENVIKLNAVCMNCYQEGSYTKRIGLETTVEVIGGADKYMAVCRDCFNLPLSEHNKENICTPVGDENEKKAKVNGRKLFAQRNDDMDSQGNLIEH